MTITLSTYAKSASITANEDTNKTNFLNRWLFGDMGTHNPDVFVVYVNEKIDLDLSNQDLTKTSMKLSESAFSKEWEKEDDSYWESY